MKGLLFSVTIETHTSYRFQPNTGSTSMCGRLTYSWFGSIAEKIIRRKPRDMNVRKVATWAFKV